MARVKARQLEPQRNHGYHGAITATIDRSIPAGAIVVVNGYTGADLAVELASNSSKRRSSGMLFILQNGGQGGDRLPCLVFTTLPTGDAPKKVGDPIWLGRDGEWSYTKPKTNPVQIGEVISSPSGNRVLLAPQARY